MFHARVAFYLFISTSRAFGFWLDMFCVMYIAVVTASFFIFGGEGGNVGLAITQALAMTGMVQWGMRQVRDEICCEYVN